MPLYPKTLGACIDELYRQRTARIELQRKADDLREKEHLLEQHIRGLLAAQGLESSRGKAATATVTTRTIGSVVDWARLFAYIKKTGNFDLIQRRINDTAFRARLDDGVEVPGVEAITVQSLSLTKAKKE